MKRSIMVAPTITVADVPSETQTTIPQYTLSRILLIWGAAAFPMAILGWLIAPALTRASDHSVRIRLGVLTVGLVWQFVLVTFLLYRETGTLRWSAVRGRLWLNTPRSPETGATRSRLWWWLIPAVLLTALFDLGVKPTFDRVWVSAFPLLAEPNGWSLNAALATPEARAQLAGAWGTWGLFLLSALFNTFLGEELLFRGVLLPRMAGAFPKSDWLVNGFLFGLYHLHQPWGILSSVTHGVLFFALPSRYFRSSWFGIVAHSGQSIFFAILILGLVLGLA
jgi:membrane protease YdiL (CAAX protease family)